MKPILTHDLIFPKPHHGLIHPALLFCKMQTRYVAMRVITELFRLNVTSQSLKLISLCAFIIPVEGATELRKEAPPAGCVNICQPAARHSWLFAQPCRIRATCRFSAEPIRAACRISANCTMSAIIPNARFSDAPMTASPIPFLTLSIAPFPHVCHRAVQGNAKDGL